MPPPDPLPAADAAELERERDLLERDFPRERRRVTELRQLLSLQPDGGSARFQLGALFHSLELPGLAERELLLAVAADETLDAAHLLLAEIHWSRSEHGRALWHLDRARQHAPMNLQAHLLAGIVLREAGAFEAAEAAVEQGLERAPFDPDLLILRGRLHVDAGEEEAAVPLLEQGLKASPDHLRGHLILGQALRALGHDERGAAELELHARLVMLQNAGALGLDPPLEEWERAAVLASHHRLTGRADLAAEELARSDSLRPGNPQARVVEALIQADGGDEAGGIAALRAVVDEFPGNTRALKALGRLLVEAADPALRDPTEAAELTGRAVALTGENDATSWYYKGLAHVALGEPEAARFCFERVLLIDRKHAFAKEELAALGED